jgi:predicted ArsR family transcriptional regulator
MMEMQERQPRNRDVLATDSRSVLLAALRAAGRPMSVGEAAAAIGTAESTARFHLSMLVSAGLVIRTAERRASAGRPSWRYAAASAVTVAPPASPDPYERLAGVLAAQLGEGSGAAAAAREAGRRWASEAAAVAPAGDHGMDAARATASVADLMDRLGFAPERPVADGELRLHACPFESVARQHRAVVCGVHLGMLEQSVAALDAGLAVAGLQPFHADDPLTCVARLVARP